jgi:site-specific DNA recombinase
VQVRSRISVVNTSTLYFVEPLQIAPEQGKRAGLYLRESKVRLKGSTNEVDSQRATGRRWAEKNGFAIPDGCVYVDNDISASAFATKARPDYQRLCRDIAAGKMDLVWFANQSRSQRELDQFVELRRLCRAHDVNWVINNRIKNLNDYIDVTALAINAVQDESDSYKKSEALLDAMVNQAVAGRPHSQTIYGYERRYDPHNRSYIGQYPVEPAASVVREIITRIADADDIAKIKRDLEARKVSTPKGGTTWGRSVIRSIATNKAYIGIRVHRPTKVVNKRRIQTGVVTEYPADWDALIDEETFYRAQNVLAARTSRSAPNPVREAKHLLTYVARGECGEYLQVVYNKRKHGYVRNYRCLRVCCTVMADELDLYVQSMIDGALVTQEFQEAIAARQADAADAVAARGEISKLKAELEENQRARESGALDLAEYLRFKKGITARLRTAEDRLAASVVVPAVVSGEVDWEDLAAARKAVAALVAVVIHPVGKGRRVPIEDRVTITPRYQ